MKHNDTRQLRHSISVLSMCALLAFMTACNSPKTYTYHDLTQIDQHDRTRFNQLDSPNMGPDWFYTGTTDGKHVIVMRPMNKAKDREYRIDESELKIDDPMEHTGDPSTWRRINHRIRAQVK